MGRAEKKDGRTMVERAAGGFGHDETGARRARIGTQDARPAQSRASAAGICRSCLDRVEQHATRQARLTYLRSARGFAAAVEAKDPCTRKHSVTVSSHAVELGTRLKLGPARLEALRIAALLHDIGKIGVPDAVLQKPGPLTAAEFNLIKRHPRLATDILRQTGLFTEELPIILYHHEWYDGTGYPDGLAGERIPQEARILCVADALDAMLSPRSYKPGFSVHRARRELLEFSGRQFDPKVVSVAVEWLDTRPGSSEAESDIKAERALPHRSWAP